MIVDPDLIWMLAHLVYLVWRGLESDVIIEIRVYNASEELRREIVNSSCLV